MEAGDGPIRKSVITMFVGTELNDVTLALI